MSCEPLFSGYFLPGTRTSGTIKHLPPLVTSKPQFCILYTLLLQCKHTTMSLGLTHRRVEIYVNTAERNGIW